MTGQSRGEMALYVLIELTEAKIDAVLSREPGRLMQLLQAELDPLRDLDLLEAEAESWSPSHQHIVRTQLLNWQKRCDYLTDILNQHLGYIDFVRSLVDGLVPGPGLDVGL